jgi:hypothetical protein
MVVLCRVSHDGREVSHLGQRSRQFKSPLAVCSPPAINVYSIYITWGLFAALSLGGLKASSTLFTVSSWHVIVPSSPSLNTILSCSSDTWSHTQSFKVEDVGSKGVRAPMAPERRRISSLQLAIGGEG